MGGGEKERKVTAGASRMLGVATYAILYSNRIYCIVVAFPYMRKKRGRMSAAKQVLVNKRLDGLILSNP